MRVLFVAPGAQQGAHMPFVRREAEGLRSQGHEVEVFGFDNRSYLRFFGEVLRLKKHVTRFRPDLVHAQFGKFNALAAVLAAGETPVVVTYRGTDINHNTRYSVLRSALGLAASQLAAALAEGVVCVSREIEDKVWGRRRSLVLPTGVDLATFVPQERDAARRQLGLGLTERIVLFNAGKNPAVKDPELAMAAVEAARAQVGPIHMVVLDGTAAPDEIPAYMNAADVLLVTSRTEGSPTVVQEAMACNLPVVSVDVGDVRERLEGVEECAVVRSREPFALGTALAKVLAAGRRSNGRIHAAALDVRCIAARLGDFYRAVVSSSMRATASYHLRLW